MDRHRFKVIKGGSDFSDSASHKKFISSFVTNTRLMGVLVVYVHWQVDTGQNTESLHQFFYVETTEYGIESYKSIYGNNQRALYEIEQSMIGSLGGEKVSLTEKETYMLIQHYSEITKELGERLPGGIEEYGFILEERVSFTDSEKKDLFKKTCVDITSDEQLINYFLMRYFTSDFVAVDYLSCKPMDREIAPNSKSIVLCINKVESTLDENQKQSFICESLIEDNTTYKIMMSEIYIKDGSIANFEVISDFAISSTEAAMKLARPEYITVFEIIGNDKDIAPALNEMYPAALKRDTKMGKAFLQFKNNNDHLKEKCYRLNDDIKGIVYVTDEDQIVLAAYSLSGIHKLENEVQYSSFGSLILALAKYEFKESILYDFMQSTTGDFLHYMEYISGYDPDE